jgi:thioredoxin reductase
MDENFDVVVVGGGAAGLSGALALSRARRSVLVVDDGTPRNAPSDGVHNYLGREGTRPADLMAAGRAEVTGYGGTVVTGRVADAQRVDGGFAVQLVGGRTVTARRLLVATGLVDELPDVDGLARRWGRDVLHCPYCHGWEVRDRAIGVLGTGPMSVHQAQLLRQWSADVTLFLHTAPDPTPQEWAQLSARGIAVVDGEVVAVETTANRLSGIRLASGTVVPREALLVAARFVSRSAVLERLGLPAQEVRFGEHVMGTAVPAGPGGATAVPGVWVAGNVGDLRAGVINAAAQGFTAATEINADLVLEDVRLATEAVGV